MALTYTADDLASAKAALVSGTLEVQIGDRRVKYRTQKELIELIQLMETAIAGSSAGASPKMIKAGYSRGGT